MSTVAVRLEGLGKRYRIGVARPRYRTLREALVQAVSTPARNLYHLRRMSRVAGADAPDLIWALRDVSVEVAHGEVLGVVGRNGAGKSTLLKILSRVTEPTTGFGVVNGRVGALLEVGTGFHPELTGRDNVYLNGAILGMDREYIRRRFDDIVAFAGVERFIDTPVKRYSSGMYLRLAFAVAAHLEPEILVVDEVLAVGDAEFQKRCLGKMNDIAGEGRTVIFVSHNLPAVRAMCTRCILLQAGRLTGDGATAGIVDRYLEQGGIEGVAGRVDFPPSAASPRMVSATLHCAGEVSNTLPMGADLAIDVHYESRVPLLVPRVGVVIFGSNGEPLINANNRYQKSPRFAEPRGAGVFRVDLGPLYLAPGRYLVSLYIGDDAVDTHVADHTLSFTVSPRDLWGEGGMPSRDVSPLWWPARFQLTPVPDPSGSLPAAGPAGGGE
jgi:lipopolysaccharide transport system ATP-binding protein